MGCTLSADTSETDSNNCDGGNLRYKEDALQVRNSEEPVIPLPESNSADQGDGRLGLITDDILKTWLSGKALDGGQIFTDPDFPPDPSSLSYSGNYDRDIVWKRVSKIEKEPYLIVDGATKTDVHQGGLGDCWFLSSCAAISQNKSIMRRLIPSGQALYSDRDSSYTGLVHFAFWRFGEWVRVCVDDYLPVINDKPAFGRCNTKNEFWVPFLEKAYAKLHGSYEAIEGGQAKDALVDLTGGISERVELSLESNEEMLKDTVKIAVHRNDTYRRVNKCFRCGAFIACSKKRGVGEKSEKEGEDGLVSGHAYTITGVEKIIVKNETVNLVRVRNPWASSTEWNGAWSDGDSHWNDVSQVIKNKLKVSDTASDGEFWISWDDFCVNFTEVTICTIGADLDLDGAVDKKGYNKNIYGEWVDGYSAGGCRNDLESFSTNPQFLLTLYEADDDDCDEEAANGKCSILIALMQEYRMSKKTFALEKKTIGFVIYEAKDPRKRLTLQYFKYNKSIGSSGTYINFREVTARLELSPGHYTIIPTTFDPKDPGRFLIRVFGQKKFDLRQL